MRRQTKREMRREGHREFICGRKEGGREAENLEERTLLQAI